MKKRKRKRVPQGPPSGGGKPSKERQLVAVDQGPLRRKAASECSREMARVGKVREEWRRFEREDKPAFERWKAATFGVLMSRLRDNESLIREKEALIHEVEMEVVFGQARNHHAAYVAVLHRRANPEPARDAREGGAHRPEDAGDDDGFADDGDEDLSEFEQELLFDEFLRAFLGLNPDRMSQAKYEKMFADFKAKVLGEPGPMPPPTPSRAAGPPKREQARIKEIYRVLVRRLHPDTRADADAEVSALWHEVQEAYGEGNLERLEMLLALTDVQANAVGGHTSLFQMRSVLRELRRSFNALQRSLGAARKDPAWNFARTPDRATLQARLQRQLDSELAAQKEKLRQIDLLIAAWSLAPKLRRRKVASNRSQPEFPF